jgi:hypothetical protein
MGGKLVLLAHGADRESRVCCGMSVAQLMKRFAPVRAILGGLTALFVGGCGTTPTTPEKPAAAVTTTAGAAAISQRAVTPGDAFVVISGGGTPLSNNYSQFLQARAMNDWLRGRYPREAVWTFFGAGNRTGAPAVFADARRQLKEGGLIVESWLPGVLDNNRPATRAEILTALKNEILPRVAKGGTLYLFVGDHGELSKDKPPESAITLWQMENTSPTGAGSGWRSDPKQVLTVTDLKTLLDEGLGAGRVVFCFTCCHAGGFHHLDVPRAVAANPTWFRGLQPVECADWTDAVAPTRAAGFTATTEDSLAAGCNPDPDPEKWLGYERHFPEALLGIDLMLGTKKGAALPSFAAAHEAATLVDRTIDKPFSTAEAWLERYAALIETAVAESPALTPAVRTAVEHFQQIVNGQSPGLMDAAFVAQEAQIARFVEALGEQNPSSAALLKTGTRAELEKAIGPKAGNGGGGGRRGGGADSTRKLWTDTIRPAWKAALVAKKVAGVPEAARGFELRLIGLEEKNPSRVFLPGDRNAVRNELFWASSYAIPAQADLKKAAIIARWEAGRREAVLDWARNSSDGTVRAAAVKWGGPARTGPAGVARTREGPSPAARKEALQRALFYRRILGAWAFLIEVDERGALSRLAALQALEQIPLPSATWL